MTPFFGPDPLREEENAEAPVEEQTVHVGAVERDNGVKSATYQSISSALYDLSDRGSLTHTVRLPHGTVIKLIASPRSSLSSYRSSFEIINGNSSPKTAVGVTQAADLAKEIDVLAMSSKDKSTLQKMTEGEAPLQEAAVKVSGYVTREGKHVGAYSQIRSVIKKLEHGQTVHFPDGISVTRKKVNSPHLDSTTEKFEIKGGSSDYQTSAVAPFDAEAAAKIVSARTARSRHPKSVGGTAPHAKHGPEIDTIPAENPKLPGTPHPEAVAKKAAAARKAAKLPSRKERAENERKAGERKTAENMKKNGGDELDNFDTGQPKVPSTKRSSEGSKRLAADNEAMAKRDARERREKARRRANDESPMPGVIRKPSESDAIRAGEGRKKQSRAPNEPAPAGVDRSEANTIKQLQAAPVGNVMTKGHGITITKEKLDDGIVFTVRGRGKKQSYTKTDLATKDATNRWLKADGNKHLIGRDRKTSTDANAAANIDRVKRESREWSDSILSREIDAAPQGELYQVLSAEARRRKIKGHPAAKARSRFHGLAESEAPGLIGR